MASPDEYPAESLDVTVEVPDEVVEEIEEELRERDRAGDGSAFLDLLVEKLELQFTNLPSYC